MPNAQIIIPLLHLLPVHLDRGFESRSIIVEGGCLKVEEEVVVQVERGALN